MQNSYLEGLGKMKLIHGNTNHISSLESDEHSLKTIAQIASLAPVSLCLCVCVGGCLGGFVSVCVCVCVWGVVLVGVCLSFHSHI